jgi:tetratricopeptide (TPR) repeat protein
MDEEQTVPAWRRWLAFWWYIWAQSFCYWGIRTAEQVFFRIGISFYTNALQVWPGYVMARYRRGLIRGRELGEYREAHEDLTSVIALHAEWPEPYLQRGLFQRFHGDPHAAIADLQQYLALGGEPYWRFEAQQQITMLREEIAIREETLKHVSM